MNYIDIEILKTFGPYTKGQIINMESDTKGIPLDRYWRARLKDSAIDNCCEIKAASKASNKPVNNSTRKPKSNK